MTKKEECNHDGTLDILFIIIIGGMLIGLPFTFMAISAIGDFGLSTWSDSISASKGSQFEVINGKTVVIKYGLPEGTYELKPLEGYGSYIKTTPPFNYFGSGFDDMFIFSTDEGFVGLYVYGKHGIHVGRWGVHDIKYDDSVPPSVTVTLLDNDWLRYEFVIPDYKYMTIGEWTIEDMEKYCHG